MSRAIATFPAPLAVAETVPEDAAGRVPLFLYGTLLDREVLERLLGRRVADEELVAARLRGFRRVRARGGPWPVLVPDPAGVVEGLLLLGPSRDDLRRIADYEDDYRAALYPVSPVGGGELALRRHRDFDGVYPVSPVGGGELAAWLYLARPEELRPGSEPWRPETWARAHKADLLRMIEVWLAEFEAREGERADAGSG